MNAMKILQSVEELLYEVMSWLLFYPRTLLLTLTRPLSTMRYSDREQQDKPDKQYLETLSPPLFLVLSVLLSHGLELAFGMGIAAERSALGQLVTQSQQNLLVFRALVFSICPLVFAWLSLRLGGREVDRETLRTPFFAQCYLAGTTAILVGVGSMGMRDPRLWTTWVGLALTLAVTVWYLAVQTAWLRHATGLGRGRAFAWALGGFIGAMTAVVGVAGVIALGQ